MYLQAKPDRFQFFFAIFWILSLLFKNNHSCGYCRKYRIYLRQFIIRVQYVMP